MCNRPTPDNGVCKRPSEFLVFLNDMEYDNVCRQHKADYQRQASPKLMKPMQGVRFVKIEQGRPFKGGGFLSMDGDQMRKVSNLLAKKGQPCVVVSKWSPLGTKYHISGITKKNVAKLTG